MPKDRAADYDRANHRTTDMKRNTSCLSSIEGIFICTSFSQESTRHFFFFFISHLIEQFMQNRLWATDFVILILNLNLKTKIPQKERRHTGSDRLVGGRCRCCCLVSHLSSTNCQYVRVTHGFSQRTLGGGVQHPPSGLMSPPNPPPSSSSPCSSSTSQIPTFHWR